jgi:hypothetical protein
VTKVVAALLTVMASVSSFTSTHLRAPPPVDGFAMPRPPSQVGSNRRRHRDLLRWLSEASAFAQQDRRHLQCHVERFNSDWPFRFTISILIPSSASRSTRRSAAGDASRCVPSGRNKKNRTSADSACSDSRRSESARMCSGQTSTAPH